MSKQKEKKQEGILEVKKTEQYRTVEELFEKSKPSSLYYTLLVLSAVVVASGLILNNAAIVIGGILIAPVLTPLLLIALAIVVGEVESVKHSSVLIAKSVGILIAVSVLMGIFFEGGGGLNVFEDSIASGILYFIVAIVSGVAATFAWVRKEVADILPGIAVSVSLVPPLVLSGLALSTFDFDLLRSTFLIFVFNFFGIVLGSMVVFSLLKFYKTQQKVHKESEEQTAEQKAHTS